MSQTVDIEKHIKVFDSLIDSLADLAMKSRIQEMIESDLFKVGERYFTSPASYRKGLHDCFPGGLLVHSLKVTRNLLDISKLWGTEFSQDSLIVCGLFHDLGKIGTLDGKLLYTPATEQWKLDKGQLYDYNKELSDGLTHAQRSIRILTRFDVRLSDAEYFAILNHDGMYNDENVMLKNSKNVLAFLLHVADHYTYLREKE